jgi:DNA-binding transcriptional regulator YiaG
MTPEEFKKIRTETLRTSQAVMAELLGVKPRAIVYWEAGERSINETVAKLVALLVKQHERGELHVSPTAHHEVKPWMRT